MPSHESRTVAWGPLLVILGGVLVIVSGLMDWATVSPPPRLVGSVTVKGSGLVLGVGVILALVGLAMWGAPTRGARIAFTIVAIVVGGLAVLIAGVTIGSKDVLISTAADKYAENTRASKTQIENALKELDSRGALDITVKAGLWLGLAGGVLVLAGGVSGIASGRRKLEPVTPEAAPAPPAPGEAPSPPRAFEPGPEWPQEGGAGAPPAPPAPPTAPPAEGEPGQAPERPF